MSPFVTKHWTHSTFIIWSFFVYFGASLSLPGHWASSLTRNEGHGVAWVEQVLGRRKRWWKSVALKCKNDQPEGHNLHNYRPKEEEAHHEITSFEPQVEDSDVENSDPNKENISIKDFEPQDEYSDMSPDVLGQIQKEYASWCGPECEFIQPKFTPPTKNENETGFETWAGPRKKREKLPLTRGKCIEAYGSVGTVTCHFTNLYVNKGNMEVHILEGDDFPSKELKIVVRSGLGAPMLKHKIYFYKHKNRLRFQQWLDDTYAPGNFTHYDGNTVAYLPLWLFNIGHALYDGLYPAFVALMQWKMHKDPFRIFLLGGEDPPNVEHMVPGAFKRNVKVLGDISGKGHIRQYELANDFVILDNLVIGMGYNGQKLDMNGNFSLGGGRELMATKYFRNHVYQSFGIPLRVRPSRAPGDHLYGMIIANKRFGSHIKWIDDVIEKAAKLSIALQYIDWGKVGAKSDPNAPKPKNPSPSGITFRAQMLLLSATDIHISSPGTAMMYQQFLPDGAVHINLGEDANLPRFFMEEQMAEGAPYIRALYYWPEKINQGYDADRIVDLVVRAKILIFDNFPIPVPVNTNLSPVLRVLKAFVYLTANDSAKLTKLAPLSSMRSPTPSFSTNYFINHFPHEYVKPFHDHQFNPCLTKELTHGYGSPCESYASEHFRRNCASWGFP